MVRRCLILSLLERFSNNYDSNCAPRSVNMLSGTPYLAIQSRTMYVTTVSAEIDFSGITSKHRVLLSNIVRMYAKPWSQGSGLTRSTWSMLKRLPVGKCMMGGIVCRVILCF